MNFKSALNVLFTTSATEDNRLALTRKLHQMSQLAEGWSHGEGGPVSEGSISVAESFVRFGSELGLKADVFPGLDGGCSVAFYREDESVEVSINSEATALSLAVEKGIGFDYIEVVPQSEDVETEYVLACILSLRDIERWKLSVFSTSDYLTETVSDSRTSSTETPQFAEGLTLRTARGGFQWSSSSALAWT